jgi:AraC-like DNA-binding protein
VADEPRSGQENAASWSRFYAGLGEHAGVISSPPAGAGRDATRATEPIAELRRSRDEIDRRFADRLDTQTLARVASLSRFHYVRRFGSTFAETPHRYLVRRRIERAKDLLRTGRYSVSEVCLEVGFESLGTFSTTFKRFVGESPATFRAREAGDAGRALAQVPGCFVLMWTRPVGDGGLRTATLEKRNPDSVR